MTIGLVGQDQITTFTSPVNGTSPIDANVVRGNDNTLKSAFNVHDKDPTIHFQSSLAAARPPAGVPGRKWLDSDTRRVYYDDGITWHEIAYLSSGAGGTGIPGPVTVTGGGITVVGGGLTTSGDIDAGGNVIAHTLFIADGTAAQNRGTVARTTGVTRWFVGANAAPETGGNAGSDLSMAAYSDAGALLREVLVVRRSTAIATWDVAQFLVRPAAGQASLAAVSPDSSAFLTLDHNLAAGAAATIHRKNGANQWGTGLGVSGGTLHYEFYNYPRAKLDGYIDSTNGLFTWNGTAAVNGLRVGVAANPGQVLLYDAANVQRWLVGILGGGATRVSFYHIPTSTEAFAVNSDASVQAFGNVTVGGTTTTQGILFARAAIDWNLGMTWNQVFTQSSAVAGGASALPATPATYAVVTMNGTVYKIPMYLP